MQSDELIQRIESRLHELGWSHQRLADEAGLTQPRVSTLLRGRHVPNLTTLRRIADALGCDLELRPRH